MFHSLIKSTGVVMVLAALAVLASPNRALAAAASYVFTTENDGKMYLSKFDGTNLAEDFAQYSGAGMLSGTNASGGGLSMVSNAFASAIVNPGVYGNGIGDVQDYAVVGPFVNPYGRHTQLSSGPDFGIYRATATAGAPGKELFSAQSTGVGVAMGDFAHDIFSGGGDGHTYIQGYDSSSYLDLGAFTIVQGVQGGNGAIIEKSTGGVYYIQADGSETLITGVTSLTDNTGAKAGDYAFFNADGKAWRYNTATDTLEGFSGLPYTEVVRIGSLVLVQYFSNVYLYDSDGNETLFANSLGGSPKLTDGVSFGDYALAVFDGVTNLYRDNGAGGLDSKLWTGVALDLSKATGDYIGVVNEIPEPASLVLFAAGAALVLIRRRA